MNRKEYLIYGCAIFFTASGFASVPSEKQTIFSALRELKKGKFIIQAGGYWSKPGKAQHINIDGLIGNDFTVSHQHGGNGLAGLGYLLDGPDKGWFRMNYGINAFYLGKTQVAGVVVQENTFANLSYKYKITHTPIYFLAKSTTEPFHSKKMALVIDAGLGSNFMKTGDFSESSLDGGNTLPDNPFSGRTTATLSAMIGVSLKLNHVLGNEPLECGYRFFYLGQGRFNKNTNQLLNTLNTGYIYANALMCSVSI